MFVINENHLVVVTVHFRRRSSGPNGHSAAGRRNGVRSAGAQKLDPRPLPPANLHNPRRHVVAADQFCLQRWKIQALQGAVFVYILQSPYADSGVSVRLSHSNVRSTGKAPAGWCTWNMAVSPGSDFSQKFVFFKTSIRPCDWVFDRLIDWLIMSKFFNFPSGTVRLYFPFF